MSSNKKLEFTFEIGTIDHLGVKLYSTIPPMIAELISNAWDADAHNVYLYFNLRIRNWLNSFDYSYSS